MANIRYWHLKDPTLPEEFKKIRQVFLEEAKEPRKRNESLHDYLLRKSIKCWCRKCKTEEVEEMNKKNEQLIV